MSTTESVNVRMDASLIRFIDSFINPNGSYESRSEVLRDLIRKEMEKQEKLDIQNSIKQGYKDLAEGRFLTSSGDIFKDLERYKEKEKNGWT